MHADVLVFDCGGEYYPILATSFLAAGCWVFAAGLVAAGRSMPGMRGLAERAEFAIAATGIPIALGTVIALVEPFPDLAIPLLIVAIVTAPLALALGSTLVDDQAPGARLNLPSGQCPTRPGHAFGDRRDRAV